MASFGTLVVIAVNSFLLFLTSAYGFYLPGVAPRDFNDGDELQVKVNKLTSTRTQLPYEYYSFGYCRPPKIENAAENLGEVLRGDRIENSPYVFHMRDDKLCLFACKIDKLDDSTVKNIRAKIDDDYRVNMILDNLPMAMSLVDSDGKVMKYYEHGFPVGRKGFGEGDDQKYFIFNHLSFTVFYHRDSGNMASRVVGFEVTPYSVKHAYEKPFNEEKPEFLTCNANTKHIVDGSQSPQEVKENEEIIFTYDVQFQSSPIKWASRWDTYLLMSDDQIHWFSIVNSLMIVLFLSGMVAMIMLRTLYQDISRYNQLETQEEAQEETGWKLVHADVFRPPPNAGLLCVYAGSGVQLLGMTVVTMIFAALGFLSPANRGGLMTAMLFVWAQTSKQASSFSLISTTFVLSKANLLFSQECSVFSLVHLCLIQLQAPGRLLPQWKHQLQFTLDPLLIHPQRRRSPFRSFMSSSVCTYICVPNVILPHFLVRESQ